MRSNKPISLKTKTFFYRIFFLLLLICLFSKYATAQPIQINYNYRSFFNKISSQKLCADLLKPEKLENISRIASDNVKSLFLSSKNGKIIKLGSLGKDLQWITELGGEIVSDLTFTDGRLFTVTRLTADNNKYVVWSLDAKTGVTIWQTVIESKDNIFFSIYGKQIFIISQSGLFQSLGLSDGKLLSKADLTVAINTAPVFSGNQVFIAGYQKKTIFSLDINNFNNKETLSASQTMVSALSPANNNLMWGEQNGIVNLLNSATKKIVWSHRYGGEISNINLTKFGLLTSSFDNFIYLNSLSDGKLLWKKRLSGRVLPNALIFGNLAVLTTTGEFNVTVVDLEKRKIVNQILSENIGSIIAKPLFLKDFLFLLTNRSLFVFAADTAICSE